MTDTERKYYLLGQAVRRMLMGQKEPVAYRYGGVVLPDIYSVYTPELQKTHPYAFIVEYVWDALGVSGRNASLYLAKEVGYKTADNGNWCVKSNMASDIFVGLTGDATDSDYIGTKWGEFRSGDYGLVVTEVDWANFDVLNEDGSDYLAKSDPIPVYE